MKPKKPGFLSSVLDTLMNTVEASVREALEQASDKSREDKPAKDEPAKDEPRKTNGVSSVIKSIVDALQKNGQLEVHYEIKSSKPHLDVATQTPKLANAVPEAVLEDNNGELFDITENSTEKENETPAIEHPGFTIDKTVVNGYHGDEACVIVPEGITQIGVNAFKHQRDIEKIVLPQSLNAIGPNAFKGCRKLEHIEIPDSVTSIGEEAFAGCTSLKSLELPESIGQFGKSCFMGCSALESIALPRSLKCIPEGMFSDCYSLVRIRWPEALESVGKDAFRDCYDSDVWTYYELQDGEMLRVRADTNELDPEHIFYLPQAPFVQSCIYNILDMIYTDTVDQPDWIAQRVSIFSTALKFCRILTADDPYAVSQMAELTRHVLLRMTREDIESGKALMSMLYMTAEAVGGSGQAYKQAEKTMYDIYKFRYRNSKNYQQAMKQSIEKALNLFGAELTPTRYNPMIWHYTASFSESWDYLNFVFRIEGLLRGLGLEITQFVPECDEDNSLEEWLAAWSNAISTYELVIIDFKAPEKFENVPNHIFSITNMAHADIIHEMLDACHCADCMTCWSHGTIAHSGLHFV